MKHLINLLTVSTNLLLTLLMLVLLSSCDSNLKPETQGKKMETFFTNNNNASLPKLQHQRGRALLATEQASSLSADFVKTQATKQTLNTSPVRNQATKQASSLSVGFIRTQATELENTFPRLPNPVLNMFIVPHLTKGGNPVPGYTTHFNLYKMNQYALPGESL